MNPMMQEALASIVRHIMTAGAGFLVTRGIWTEQNAVTYVAAGALAVVGVGWGLYQKYVARTKLVTALVTPAGKTEEQIEVLVSAGHAPSVTTSKTEVPTKVG